MYKLVLSLCLSFVSFFAYGQEIKIEQESKISRANFPKIATQYLLEHFSKAQKVKYFREKSNDSIFFEAKFVENKKKFSVKFDEKGKLYDTEQTVKFEEIDKDAQKTIKDELQKLYTKFVIQKTQIQWSSSQNILGYELEIKAYAESGDGIFEINSNKNGNIIRKRQIPERAKDIYFW